LNNRKKRRRQIRYYKKKNYNNETKSDIWIILSTISQIGIFLLALFGYFYTIRPVYQNQMLSEKNSKLVMENTKLKKDNDDLELNINENIKTIEKQTSKINFLDTELKELEEKNKLLENNYDELNAELKEIRSEKIKLQNSLEKMKTSYLLEGLASYFYQKISANLINRVNSFELLNNSYNEEDVLNYLGEPYKKTENIIEEYFNPNRVTLYNNLNDEVSINLKSTLINILNQIKSDPSDIRTKISSIEMILDNYHTKKMQLKQKIDDLDSGEFNTYKDYKKEFDYLNNQYNELDKLTIEKIERIKEQQKNPISIMIEIIDRLEVQK
jgi:Tfp pilus assembly protein PilN